MLVWLATAAWAKAPEVLHPGEMYGHWGGWTGNAYTTPKGSVMLHPLNRSSFGLTDFMDLKASFLGELIFPGPHLALEVAPVQNARLALSLEARAATTWAFRYVDYGLVPHLSFRTSETVMIDASVGVHGLAGDTLDEGDTTGTSNPFRIEREPGLSAVRPELSLNFQINDPLCMVLTGRYEAVDRFSGAQGALGAYFVYGKGPLGVSAGGNLSIVGTGGVNAFLARIEQDLGFSLLSLPPNVPLPLPHLQLWMRL